MSFLSSVGPYLVVGLACGSGGVLVHALMAKVKMWDAKHALAQALPEIARRFETDVAFQRACYNYSATARTHQCELAAMIAALEAYENVRDEARLAALPAHQRRRYTDGLADAERHSRTSGGEHGQGD